MTSGMMKPNCVCTRAEASSRREPGGRKNAEVRGQKQECRRVPHFLSLRFRQIL